MGFAISLEAESAIRVAGCRRTAGMARRVLRLLDMAETADNIRWIQANMVPVEAEHLDEEGLIVVDFGYLSRIPVVASV